MLTKSSDIRTL